MKKFGKCTASILLTLIMTLQLMFVSGISILAGNETVIVPIESEVNISGVSLVLNGEIGLVYHVYVPDDYPGAYVILSCKDKSVKTKISDCADLDMDLRYMFTWHLSAIELAEAVTLTVYDAGNKMLAEKTCSVQEYVSHLRTDVKATEKEKAIGEALINYGYYAQLACSKANGWVIGEDYEEITAYNAPDVDTSVFSDYDITWSTRTGSFKKLTMSLHLDYTTSIILYIPLDEKPTVIVNGDAVEAVESERITNTYQVEIPGINVLNLADKYEVSINDVTVEFSAFSYCKLAVDRHASTETINAVRALYEFYEATDKYLNPGK